MVIDQEFLMTEKIDINTNILLWVAVIISFLSSSFTQISQTGPVLKEPNFG